MEKKSIEELNALNSRIQKEDPDAVFDEFGTRSSGLNDAEVSERLSLYGKNKINEVKGKSIYLVFLSHFISLMAILLWFGGLIAMFADMLELGIAIWLVNIINGLFSFKQEYQADKATEALKKMLPSYARVIRNDEQLQILAEDLVVGDIMVIEEGDKISADARLISSSDLQVNQSTLTGESNPVRKNAEAMLREDLSRFEIPNLIFTGTNVASGTGMSVVIATAMNTEFGKIANLTQTMEEVPSPLQVELNRLTKQISIIAISIGLVFFLAGWLFVGDSPAKSFIFALGMIVAFIPEGLLPTVTLSLAKAVQQMAKEHALVKRLSAVETLGSTSVICSDKTGTLTQNEMTVSNLWLFTEEFEVTGLGYAPEGDVVCDKTKIKANQHTGLNYLLTGAALCSNARVVEPNEENDRYTVLGDPTEACLGVVAQKAGLDLNDLNQEYPRLRELPFDSRRKRMTTIHQLPKPEHGATRIAFIKGAPKEIMELSTQVDRNGTLTAMSEEDRQSIMEANDRYARNGLRVLAVAYRLIDKNMDLPTKMSDYTPELIEQDLVFVGLVVMADPARPEVAAAVKVCHEASIRIIMITGDYGLTAESIAKKIGIVKGDHPRVVTGLELEKLSDDELKEALNDEVIFARVAPEQKYRVVANLQEMGNIVAVTGDGVNDSPALKKADIGVAMGITGTDVAKEAADMILTDDNFASIVKAVEEGRAVYSNIQKFILYIFNSNMAEAVPSAAFLFSKGGIPLPLTVMQILAIDLGTDMVPALGLGVEPPEEGIMSKPPRKRTDTLLNRKIIIKAFLWYGLLASIFAMGAYFLVNFLHGWPNVPLAVDNQIYREATTLTLGSIIFAQIGAVMNCRTEKQSVFNIGLLTNKRILKGIVLEIVILIVLSYVPFFQGLFNTAPISWQEWIYLCIIPIPIVLIEEIRKSILRKKSVK